MKADVFHGAACHVFRGWDEVKTYRFESNGDHVVQLRVSDRRLEAAVMDKARLVAELFVKGDLDDLAKRIVSNRRAHGLRRYGRKR